jgi:hypothetical protein
LEKQLNNAPNHRHLSQQPITANNQSLSKTYSKEITHPYDIDQNLPQGQQL